MRVGTSQAMRAVTYRVRDHPHACGDKSNFKLWKNTIIGSSPCVWGQVHMMSWYTFVDRIIPMRVGTSSDILPFLVRDKDHPHACGDKKSAPQALLSDTGSSPCVWGQAV